MDYSIRQGSNFGHLEILEHPQIMSINLEVEDLKKNYHSYNTSDREDLYGKKLSKNTYFAMFKGLIPPKLCEIVAYSKVTVPVSQTTIANEGSFTNMNAYLNNEAAKNLEEFHDEEHKNVENDVSSTSAESIAQGGNKVVDPQIAKLLNSDVFFEKIQGASGDLRNTIRL